jgi:ABC-2 type transport system ATP-binding protein
MIEFHNVTRSYYRKVAVSDLCLTVQPGEIFALLGPNGAGKTTTIKMLVGLLRPDSGTIRVCGHDLLKDMRQALHCLGYVPDEPFLYDKLSGREFLDFAAQIRGLNRSVIDVNIAEEIKNLEMDDYIDDLVETYSHGMKQRLVFAAALLHRPPVVVIDEPMMGLDPRSMRMVKDLLRARVAAGVTVLMSTHILAMAEEIADRIGIIDHGRLQYIGAVSPHVKEPDNNNSLESLFLQITDGSNGNSVPAEPLKPESIE